MLLWKSVFALNLNVCLYSHKTERDIFSFISFVFFCFFHFELLGSNTIKNELGKKIQYFFGIGLIKYSSEFQAHNKKYLCHAGSPKNLFSVLT